ncbi:hypothetical protein FACS1894189_4120 [Planctomycetales bacterium]|nr:hypothetical protein FACS1894189_4120 [Planctomycetales bacterium]
MAASVEDFVIRLTRGNRKFTFVFTEDFFDIMGKSGVRTDRFRDIRSTVKNVGTRKGTNAALVAKSATDLFDVDVAVIGKGFSSFMTTFEELATGPFSDKAVIYGEGGDLIDAQKAKFQVASFFSEKEDHMISTAQLIADIRKRKIVLVVESPADLKRPSLEPFIKLRSQLTKILISPIKGPVVDCQISKVFQEGNSSSLSSLLNMFCVHYK